MGRKKSVEQATENPLADPSATNGAVPTLTGAIVQTLNALGANAETAAVKAHIETQFPGVDVEASSFPSTLSLKRKALREGGSGRPSRKQKPATSTSRISAPRLPAVRSEPTLNDLLRIKEAADKHGGLEALRQNLESIRGVADEAGGLDRLSFGLDMLRKLTGK